jgi:glycosyltransferase involved in cell wall biosynthesis
MTLPKRPLITVGIPAYNRATLLPVLLDSIFSQSGTDFEILICEDASPQREEIREVVRQYATKYPGVVSYYENSVNLGYDGNLRRLVALAKGDYVLFMGNDDLLADGALRAVANAVAVHPNVGVVLRSYDSFFDDPDVPVQTFRYFDKERFFPAGKETIVTFFRRCVFISGMVIRRDHALKESTDRFDGTLLYQQHLVGQVLARENGVYLPQILSHHRLGGTPDFGNSAAEKGRFVPQEQTPESSVHFMRGMLQIAGDLERTLGLPVFRPILRDIGNYAYPILSIQAGRTRGVFLRYAIALARLGLWRVPMFHVYVTGLLCLGRAICDSIISKIKQRLGRAPVIGRVYTGQ